MLKDITLGQFFPGNSLLHRADPRMKIILSFMYIVFVFMANSTVSYVLTAVFTVFLVIISTIKPIIVLKALKPVVFIMLFTAFFNVFWTKGDAAPLVDVSFLGLNIRVYSEGIWFALKMVVRLVCILTGSCVLLTYTTSPISLTDGLERLLAPLKVIKLPVHEFSMMITIALRFIPTLIEETDKIMNAQKARGADFSSGGLVKRAKALLPVLIPLFASSFRRAGELATAMECRCYRGDNGRTRMTKLKYTGVDAVLLLIMAAFGAGVILSNIYLKSVLAI
ncbi:MAG: energy-coupling factor transporter transmembrane protein EcfT [Ruminococcaceae bacterium]|nr:energy-coupling factor transporter transmembrane protein EcfT [Oscillospiraceae bacterium]